jgi:hypothetical protein
MGMDNFEFHEESNTSVDEALWKLANNTLMSDQVDV